MIVVCVAEDVHVYCLLQARPAYGMICHENVMLYEAVYLHHCTALYPSLKMILYCTVYHLQGLVVLGKVASLVRQ